MATTYEATLVHGLSYSAFGCKFEVGIPGARLLTADEKAYLETHAIHTKHTHENERIEVCKFTFKQKADPADLEPEHKAAAPAPAAAPVAAAVPAATPDAPAADAAPAASGEAEATRTRQRRTAAA